MFCQAYRITVLSCQFEVHSPGATAAVYPVLVCDNLLQLLCKTVIIGSSSSALHDYTKSHHKWQWEELTWHILILCASRQLSWEGTIQKVQPRLTTRPVAEAVMHYIPHLEVICHRHSLALPIAPHATLQSAKQHTAYYNCTQRVLNMSRLSQVCTTSLHWPQHQMPGCDWAIQLPPLAYDHRQGLLISLTSPVQQRRQPNQELYVHPRSTTRPAFALICYTGARNLPPLVIYCVVECKGHQ